MTDREKELNQFAAELDRELGTYIHKPDKMNVQDGESCWLDQARICGPDCVAFNVDGVGIEPEQETQGHTKCVVLASQSSNLITIAKLSASLRKSEQTLAALAARLAPSNPNVPT